MSKKAKAVTKNIFTATKQESADALALRDLLLEEKALKDRIAMLQPDISKGKERVEDMAQFLDQMDPSYSANIVDDESILLKVSKARESETLKGADGIAKFLKRFLVEVEAKDATEADKIVDALYESRFLDLITVSKQAVDKDIPLVYVIFHQYSAVSVGARSFKAV